MQPVLINNSVPNSGVAMEVTVVETTVVEVQELTLAELAQISGGMGDACWL